MLGERVASLVIAATGVEGDRAFAAGSAKRIEALFALSARTRERRVEILFPDGSVVAVDDPGIHAALSRALGMPVTLQKGDVDDAPVHIVTTASLARLGLDERRFRPNIVLEAEGEEDWLGRTLTVGAAKLLVTHPTERCVMTTLAQADLPADPKVLRALDHGVFGVYAKVIQPGRVRVGDPAS
jgi:uncharacterized protein YcbX